MEIKEEKMEACNTPKKELMNSALKHYEEASTAIHHWNSGIPQAIRHYYSEEPKLNKTGLISVGVCIGFLAGVFIGYIIN